MGESGADKNNKETRGNKTYPGGHNTDISTQHMPPAPLASVRVRVLVSEPALAIVPNPNRVRSEASTRESNPHRNILRSRAEAVSWLRNFLASSCARRLIWLHGRRFPCAGESSSGGHVVFQVPGETDLELVRLLSSDHRMRSGYLNGPMSFRVDTRDRGVFDAAVSLVEETGGRAATTVDVVLTVHLRANALKLKRTSWTSSVESCRVSEDRVLELLMLRGNSDTLSACRNRLNQLRDSVRTQEQAIGDQGRAFRNVRNGQLLDALRHPCGGNTDARDDDEARGDDDVCDNMRGNTDACEGASAAGETPEGIISGLECDLLPFQRRTVRWMLGREREDLRDVAWMWIPFWAPSHYNARANMFTDEDDAHPEISGVWYSPLYHRFMRSAETARGGMLCTEMGLGKTVMAMALVLGSPALRDRAEGAGGTLVVCPVNLVGQWKRELEDKAPGLTVRCHHGANRTRRFEDLRDADVVITTYGIVMSEKFTRVRRAVAAGRRPPPAPLDMGEWTRVVFDESHILRNGTTTTTACRSLCALRRWCVTGTPFCGNLRDVHHQLALLRMHVSTGFSGAPSSGLWQTAAESLCPVYRDVAVSAELMVVLRAVVARHDKRQILPDGRSLVDLPPKTEETRVVRLTPHEREVYSRMERDANVIVNTLSGGRSAAMRMLRVLVPLRQFASIGFYSPVVPPSRWRGGAQCVLPATPEDTSFCAENTCSICLMEFADEVVRTGCNHYYCAECLRIHMERRGRSATCPLCRRGLAQGLRHIRLVAEDDEDEENPEPVAPAPPNPNEATRFSKVRAFHSDLNRILTQDSAHKVLLFSGFHATLEKLSQFLKVHAVDHSMLTGSMSQRQRSEALRGFQSPEGPRVFLLSSRAAAVGVNLTSATHVILFDVNGSAEAEEQAIGRAWRIGQRRPVRIIRYVTESSVESRLLEIRSENSGQHHFSMGNVRRLLEAA